MQLSRKLRSGLTGVDVATLHRELTQLGLTIPDNEAKQRRFGKGTQKAVTKF